MEEKQNDPADHWQMIIIGLIGIVAFVVIAALVEHPFMKGVLWFLAGTSGIIYATGVAVWSLRTFRKTHNPAIDTAEVTEA